MEDMFRLALLAALAAASFAQDRANPAPKPPADVDQALRERITEFYKYHVSEEYRKAEKLVAEDSQDTYYVSSKPRYLSFEIKTIEYADNFTKAKVSVLCEQYFHTPIFAGKPMKSPSTSTWKLENGKWVWYVDKDELAKGAFGKMANAGSKAEPGAVAPQNIPTSLDYVLGKVKLDKDTLVVKPNATEQVTITNNAPVSVSLVVQMKLPGYEIAFDKTDLKTGEKAVVTVKTNDNPHTGELQFLVNPLGEILSVTVKRN
jgi:hypothetical protein